MAGLGSDSEDTVNIDFWTDLDADQTTEYKKFSPPGGYGSEIRIMKLQRDVSSEDVETQKLERMPGFTFSWWYTGLGVDIIPDNRYDDEWMNKQFVR